MAEADQDAKKNKISWIVALAQSIKRPLAFFGSIRVSQRYFGAFRCFSWVI